MHNKLQSLDRVWQCFLCRMKDERSPKPKKKFGSNFGSTLRKSTIGSIRRPNMASIRRPNMANIKQKIKSKLRRGEVWLSKSGRG